MPLDPVAESAPADLSLMEVSARIADRRLSPVELTETMLSRIDAYDGALKSYQHVMAESARAEASRAESEIASGFHRGPLHGVPIAVKDLCRTHDAPTAAGMKIHEDHASDADSTVVARLRAAGAVLLGKLAMTEGAYAGHHPQMPTPLNPFNPDVWTGASSSGSGAATAAGLCFGSLGSDTGGSIRFPSHACGITGLKGTWGRVSRHGVFALADSLDHVGPMARTAMDCAAMMTVLSGADAKDPTALKAPVPDYVAACQGGVSGLRIGLDQAMLGAIDPAIAQVLEDAARALESLGARITPFTLPDQTGLAEAWDAICFVECAIAHEATWPARRDEYGPQLSAVLDGAAAVDQMTLGKADQRRLVYRGQWDAAVMDVDMVLLPIVGYPTPDMTTWNAFLSGEADGGALGELLRFTAPADMTGHPALTLPAGMDGRGAPVGVQLVGPHLGEASLFRAGHAFQTVTDWHARRPDLSVLPL